MYRIGIANSRHHRIAEAAQGVSDWLGKFGSHGGGRYVLAFAANT